MPTADPITMRKLALAKELYRHAVSQATHDTVTSRILAVMSFDLSTETLLRAAVGSLDSTRTPSDGFAGLIQQVESLLAGAGFGALPDRANVLQVHSIRNDAQHRARNPTTTEVSDARTYTRDFLSKATALIWSVNLDTVSLVDLVNHVKLKQLLGEAEQHFQSGDTLKMCEKACTAVQSALDFVDEAIVGRIPGFIGGFVLQDSWGKVSKSPNDTRTMMQAFERTRETVLLTALGLNYTDQVRFRRLAGYVIFLHNGGVDHVNAKPNLSAAEAEFVLGYAVGAVQQIEAIVGDVEDPFK